MNSTPSAVPSVRRTKGTAARAMGNRACGAKLLPGKTARIAASSP